MAAAMIENRVPDMAAIRDGFDALRKKSEIVLVEGAGGWLVPITATYSMADLAADFALPVLVVVNNKLGALNHTLLTVRAIESGPLRCAGIILNQAADTRDAASISNRILLEKLLPHVPIIAEIMHGEECLDPALLASL
jgi:dethiobiotin synthetase